MGSNAEGPGRLCNALFRNFALHKLATKFNLYVSKYAYAPELSQLGLTFYSGHVRHARTLPLDDKSYEQAYASSKCNNNFTMFHGYFQTQDLSDRLCHDLRTTFCDSIRSANPHRNRYGLNNDIGVHVRLDDVANLNFGLDYYVRLIDMLNGTDSNIFIGTDDPKHLIVQQLLQRYPNSKCLQMSPVETIQFLSTCSSLVLSQGTFSAVIGYLAFDAKTIYFPDGIHVAPWHPIEIFRNKGFLNGLI